jgi:hypothetical protein
MRIVAFRSGLVDHTLLAMLAEKDGKVAEEIVRKIVPSATEYRTDPAAYHAARRRILDALDGESAPDFRAWCCRSPRRVGCAPPYALSECRFLRRS